MKDHGKVHLLRVTECTQETAVLHARVDEFYEKLFSAYWFFRAFNLGDLNLSVTGYNSKSLFTPGRYFNILLVFSSDSC